MFHLLDPSPPQLLACSTTDGWLRLVDELHGGRPASLSSLAVAHPLSPSVAGPPSPIACQHAALRLAGMGAVRVGGPISMTCRKVRCSISAGGHTVAGLAAAHQSIKTGHACSGPDLCAVTVAL